jgi:hypothetical protein
MTGGSARPIHCAVYVPHHFQKKATRGIGTPNRTSISLKDGRMGHHQPSRRASQIESIKHYVIGRIRIRPGSTTEK